MLDAPLTAANIETHANYASFSQAHRYRIGPAGAIRCEHMFSFAEGMVDPPRLGVRLTVPGELEDLTWFGPGPHETQCDRNQAPVGRYWGSVADQYVPYAVQRGVGSTACGPDTLEKYRIFPRHVQAVLRDVSGGVRRESPGGQA